MRRNYEIDIKPSEITQDLINKIEEFYLNSAYKEHMDKYTWGRPIGTTITAEEIKQSLQEQLETEKNNFIDFEVKMYKDKYGKEPDIDAFYKECMDDELTLENRRIEFYSNPCYGAYVEGMSYTDIHLKIKFIVSNGRFYVFLENAEWFRKEQLDKATLKRWNDMIVDIYYNWYINDIPVHIPYNYRTKVKKKLDKV